MGNLPEIKTHAERCTPFVLLDLTVTLCYDRMDPHALVVTKLLVSYT